MTDEHRFQLRAEKGVALGYAPLGADLLVPAAHLPRRARVLDVAAGLTVAGTTAESTLLASTLSVPAGSIATYDVHRISHGGTCAQASGANQTLRFRYKVTINGVTTTLIDTGTIALGTNANPRMYVIDIAAVASPTWIDIISARLSISGAGTDTWRPRTATSAAGGADAFARMYTSGLGDNGTYPWEYDLTVQPGSTAWTVLSGQALLDMVPYS